MDQTTNSSSNIWYTLGGIVVIIALAFWLFGSATSPAPSATTQTPSDNTASALTSEFNQTADASAALDQDAAASAQVVQGF